jgi:hypothetical protein
VAGIGLVVVFASMEAALAAHHKATRHSPLVIDPVRRTPTPTPSAPGVTATMMTGPGCPVAGGAWSAAQSRADGWITVGGGTPQCGGQALATYTTTSTTSAQDTYSWWFRTARTATCALRIFVPNAAPSSAAAHYEVFAAESRLGGFDIVQARHKGEWVDAGTWKVTGGLLQAQLTDRADYAGAHHHVTAAAASLACR